MSWRYEERVLPEVTCTAQPQGKHTLQGGHPPFPWPGAPNTPSTSTEVPLLGGEFILMAFKFLVTFTFGKLHKVNYL